MANISSYPLIAPKVGDLILFTETYDINAAAPVIGNPTRATTIKAILDLGVNGGSGVASVNGETGIVSLGITELNDVTSSGTVGQVLTKNANNTYDFVTPGSVEGIIGYIGVVNGVATLRKEVTMPSNTTSISTNGFNTQGITSLTLNEGLISIGENAFGNNPLIGSVVFPSTLTSIDNYAFSAGISPRINKLTAITLNEGLLTIGDFALAYNALSSVTIPNSVTSIGNYAFSLQTTMVSNVDTQVLTSLVINGTGKDIGDYAFGYNKITSLTIPNNTTMGNNSFISSISLTNLIIGSNVTLGMNTFNNSSSLISVNIPNDISLDVNTFAGASSLTSFTIAGSAVNTVPSLFNTTVAYPNGYVPGGTFSNCDITGAVTIGDGLTFGTSIFSNSDNITSIIIGNNVTAISGGTFSKTVSNTVVMTSIQIGTGFTATSASSSLFQYCITNSLVIGDNTDLSLGSSYFTYTKITSLTLGNNVDISSRLYGNGHFASGKGILPTLTIPGTTILDNGLAANPPGIFDNWTPAGGQIQNIIIENGITEIPYHFAGNSGVTSVSFPSSLTSIIASAFRDNLLTGTLNFSTIITIETQAFTDNQITTVNVPIGSTINGSAFDAGVTINYI